jgi:hypothetical protein
MMDDDTTLPVPIESPLRWRSGRPPQIETSREPGDFSIEASPHAPHRSGHGPAGGSLLQSNQCASWRKRWPTCGATVRFLSAWR